MTHDIALPGGGVARLDLVHSARARRYILRFDDRSGQFRLTVPKGGSERAALHFALGRGSWMEACLKGRVSAPLGHGAFLPVNGTDHRLVFTQNKTRSIVRIENELKIGGPADLALSRLERYLKGEAKEQLVPMVHDFAAAYGAQAARVSFGDMRSRWGSCSSSGTVKLSWRLIMAPKDVQAYVAAHEAAHLIELNHSDRFWALVEAQIPDWRLKRQWLRHEGSRLMGFDFKSLPENPFDSESQSRSHSLAERS